MPHLQKTGLIVCLSVSALISACSDDDNGDNQQRDASVDDSGTRDSGARDASVASIDASLDASIDAALRDATTDAAIVAPDARPPRQDPFVVELTPEAELPPCAMAGEGGLVPANGGAVVTYEPTLDELLVSVNFANLSGPATAAHIHYGTATDAMGPVVLAFKGDLSGDINQMLTEADYRVPPSGVPATFGAFLLELYAGKAYVNVHTAACPNGEIRGQIK